MSEELNLPVYQIGKYRARFPLSDIGEADAWVTLFRDLSNRKWRNCILETTGLNSRESFLGIALPPQRIVTIKLEAPRNVLYKRIKGKKKIEHRGGEWLFSRDYQSKFEFVKKLFREFKRIPAEIKINTGKLGPHEVYKTALEKLGVFVLIRDKVEIANTDSLAK